MLCNKMCAETSVRVIPPRAQPVVSTRGIIRRKQAPEPPGREESTYPWMSIHGSILGPRRNFFSFPSLSFNEKEKTILLVFLVCRHVAAHLILENDVESVDDSRNVL